jgi:hypothetical protein
MEMWSIVGAVWGSHCVCLVLMDIKLFFESTQFLDLFYNMPFGVGLLVKVWLGDLMERRQTQISKTCEQLYHLTKLRHECPNTVIDFLMMTHKINQCRTVALGVVGSDDVRSTLGKHLDDIDSDIDRIEGVLASKQPCLALANLILNKVSEAND